MRYRPGVRTTDLPTLSMWTTPFGPTIRSEASSKFFSETGPAIEYFIRYLPETRNQWQPGSFIATVTVVGLADALPAPRQMPHTATARNVESFFIAATPFGKLDRMRGSC